MAYEIRQTRKPMGRKASDKEPMPFEQTQIGFGFEVPATDYDIGTVRSSCRYWSGKLGRKFQCEAGTVGLARVECVGTCEVTAKPSSKPRPEPATEAVDLAADPWAGVGVAGPGLAPGAEPEADLSPSWVEGPDGHIAVTVGAADFAALSGTCPHCGRAPHPNWPCLI